MTTRNQHYEWIDSTAGLAPLADALARTSELALDTESNSMFAYRERLCLVQIGIPTSADASSEPQIFLIDPLAFSTPKEALAPLLPWLVDPAHRVLLHGGEYDVGILKRDVGIGPARVFDTQAAAAILGIEKTGFGSLVEAFHDVKLPKSHQQFDWARRPIPQAALGYAIDDVRWLIPLARAMESVVREADFDEEVAIASTAVADARPHAPRDPAQTFWRVLGGARLSHETLSLLVALVAWRERAAESRDVPPARLVPNDGLLRLAEQAPTSPDSLQGFGLPKDLRGRELIEVIEHARAHPPSIPQRPPRPKVDPQRSRREERLKRWREQEATSRAVPLQVVLPARALEHLAEHGLAGLSEATPQLGAKRLARYRDALTSLVT